ncbi:hypothetical protein D5b_00501 [Faustovirus]|nr:hypothetical protein D5b_00501 [Faustovirus]AMN84420.1 hypothetical protein D6_00007 [Faustovirus]AMP44439.1 hypothetical protein PRJ_Dakar_00489 [Faustovirus]
MEDILRYHIIPKIPLAFLSVNRRVRCIATELVWNDRSLKWDTIDFWQYTRVIWCWVNNYVDSAEKLTVMEVYMYSNYHHNNNADNPNSIEIPINNVNLCRYIIDTLCAIDMAVIEHAINYWLWRLIKIETSCLNTRKLSYPYYKKISEYILKFHEDAIDLPWEGFVSWAFEDVFIETLRELNTHAEIIDHYQRSIKYTHYGDMGDTLGAIKGLGKIFNVIKPSVIKLLKPEAIGVFVDYVELDEMD